MIKKINSFIYLLLSYILICGQMIAYAQSTAAILPQGVTQFLDNDGNPLSSGKIDFYIPNTTTRKTTWQDANETIPNANPVVLDAAGRAKIYGAGTYRQIVKDRNGNLIYDAVTASAGTGGSSPTATGDGDLVGTVKPWAGLIAPNQYAFAYGQELSRTTYSVLFTAITLQQTISCTSGSATASGFSDTSQIPLNAVIESICFAPGTVVVSKTSTTVTFNNNSAVSSQDAVRIFIYGNGNGSTTFNLPDLRGYVIAGRCNMGGTNCTNLTGAGFGSGSIGSRGTGAKGGVETVALVTNNLPPYTPSGTIGSTTATGALSGIINAVITDPGHTHNILSLDVNSLNNGGILQGSALNAGANAHTTATATTGISATVNLASGSFNGSPHNHTFTGTAQGGTSTPVSVVQPTQTLNYIIKITPDTNSTEASGVTSLGGMTGDIACGAGVICTGNIISASQSGVSSLGGMTGIINCGSGVTCASNTVTATANLPGAAIVTNSPYNAACDGITDDTAAIQAAINSGASLVVFPAGTCAMNGSANITGVSNQTIMGLGKTATTIKMIGDQSVVGNLFDWVSKSNFEVRNLTFDWNNKTPAGSSLAIFGTNLSSDFRFENIRIIHGYNGGAFPWFMMRLTVPDKCKVTNSEFLFDSAVLSQTNDSVSLAGTGTRCIIKDNISINSAIGLGDTSNSIIANNIVDGWAFGSAFDGGASSNYLIYQGNIAMNGSTGIDGAGVRPGGFEVYAGYSIASGNISHSNGGAGIHWGGTYGAITGNVTIDNGQRYNAPPCSTGGHLPADQCYFGGMESRYNGVDGTTSAFSAFVGNTGRSLSGSQRYGWSFVNGGTNGQPSYQFLTGNVFDNNDDANYAMPINSGSIPGYGATVWDAPYQGMLMPPLIRTASITPGLITAGSTYSGSMTFAGAYTSSTNSSQNDLAMCSMNNLTSGALAVTANVISNNTVNYNITNFSGVNQTIGAGVITCYVYKAWGFNTF